MASGFAHLRGTTAGSLVSNSRCASRSACTTIDTEMSEWLQDDVIVSGSNDCKIKVWSASTGTCIRTLVGHEALVRALSFDPRSGRLVSASYDKTVKVWDLGSGALSNVSFWRAGWIADVFFGGQASS